LGVAALADRPQPDAIAHPVVAGLDYMAGEGWSSTAANEHSKRDHLDPFVQRVCEWWTAVPPKR
jgi:hypothetical protein